MKATLTFEGKTVEVEISETEAQKIFNEPKKTGWEYDAPGEIYFHLDRDGVEKRRDSMNEPGKSLHRLGNYFTDDALANDQARAISLWLRIKRWAAEHCEPVDWKGRSDKYSFYWDYVAKRVCVSGVLIVCRTAFAVYFDTPDHAEQCIEEFRNELLWYFTECRDRMDGREG